MKVKFRFGIKSYSGTADDFNYANFADRNVVVGRMVPVDREITAQNENLGRKASNISVFYSEISDAYKEDLRAYAKKMYKLKAFRKQLAGNVYGLFTKVLWAASKDVDLPVNLEALSIDDTNLGSYDNILTVSDAVNKGYLPKVEGYENFVNPIAV